MTMTRPDWHTPKGQRRRDALLQAAMEVIAERGYAGTTQRSIATQAGVPAASTHYFFDSVDQLAAEAAVAYLRERVAFYEDLIDGYLAAGRSIADGIREVAAVLSAVAVERRVGQFEIYLNAPRHEALRPTVEESMRRLDGVAARVLHAAGVPDADEWSPALLALGDGFALQQIAGSPSSPEVFERAITSLVITARMDAAERQGWMARFEAESISDGPNAAT